MNKIIKALFYVLMIGLVASTAFGQQPSKYPAKPVQLIVPYTPGGNPDVLARILAQRLSDKLGGSFIVDNRPGSGGNIGAEKVASSNPDGYTLGVFDSAQTSINPSLYRKLSYGAGDLVPIAALAIVPTVLVVNPSVPSRSFGEFLAYARANPDKLNYGSSGNGSIHHLTAAMFAGATGTKLTHVPYKGSSQAIPAVVSGEIQLMFSGIPNIKPFLDGDRLKIVAISTAQRAKSLPFIPTLAELGLRNFSVASNIGLFAPKNTPLTVQQSLAAAVKEILADKEVEGKLESLGMEILRLDSREYRKYLEADRVKFSRAVVESGLTLD